jgi:DNA-binding CsgD family transcriptional regulator
VHYPWDNVPVPQQAIEFLDALRPHLARAALLSGRLWMARARSVVQAFQAMGLPAAALSPDGRVIAFNDHFSSDGRIVAAAGNRIGLHDPRAKSLFENGLIQLRVGHPTVLSILLPGHADYETAVLHLIPVRGAGRDVFAGSLTLVVLTAMSPHALPSADLLHALFDLTPAEARLARGLATGQTLSELAHSSAVSRETLRTHLKAVLAKTGMSRQTDLARLLSRLPPEA